MDLRETQAGVAPLDNAVNTKGTGPGAAPSSVCTRRAAYVHLTHSLAVRPVSAAMRGGAARWVAVALAVAVEGGATQTRVQTSSFCMRVGNSPDLRGSEKAGGREQTDVRKTERTAEGARKGETERGKEKGRGDGGETEKEIERERGGICIYGRYIARLAEGTSLTNGKVRPDDDEDDVDDDEDDGR
ncbi:hypothetical protein ALC62_11795 [Cyphomyrmex costatus]|uniref:Uncharacterized protein n=1 Tax=Cyphomyrmex costatus TaxID=456900 RepID=A0A195CBC2_9HYME|nr:hypothetical protein ALC62_11795 [Cyphomyrmex costatus]